MKRELPLILIFCLIFAGFLNAQKTKEYRTGIRYVITPKQELPANLKNYTIVVESPLNMITWSEQLRSKDIEKDNQKVRLDSARRTLNVFSYPRSRNDTKFDFTIKITTSDIKVDKLNDQVDGLQDNDPVFTYTYGSKLEVFDNDAKNIMTEELSNISEPRVILKKQLVLNQTLKLQLQLQKNNNEKRRETLNNFLKEHENLIFITTLEDAKEVLKGEFMSQSGSLALSIMGAKGDADYTALTQTAEQLQASISKVGSLSKSNAVSLETVSDMFAKAIPLWQDELKQENTTDKKARINSEIGNGIRYNLAVAYFWMMDYAKALEYLDKVPESISEKGKFVIEGSFKDNAQKLRELIYKFEMNDKRATIVH